MQPCGSHPHKLGMHKENTNQFAKERVHRTGALHFDVQCYTTHEDIVRLYMNYGCLKRTIYTCRHSIKLVCNPEGCALAAVR